MSSMLPVSSPRTHVPVLLRGRGRGRTIGTPVRPDPASTRNQSRIQSHFSRNNLKSNAPWTDGSQNADTQASGDSSADEPTSHSESYKGLSGTSFGDMSRRPANSMVFDDTNRKAFRLKSTLLRSPSDKQESKSDEYSTECEETSMSGSFRNPSPNEILGTADSSENLWILPLVGPRPRLDGAKHYDLVCEKDPLLLTYGFVSQALWIMEERLFNDPELNDRQKAMNALWTRWLALYRVDFIENPRLCCTNFLEHRYEIIHHAAGWDAFRSWILALKYNNYLTQNEMISIIELYNQRAAHAAGCVSSLSEAQTT